MPGGEGGEARGRLSCSPGDLALVAEGPDGPVTFAFRVVGVEDCGGGSSQHFLVVQRTARLAGSIRREAAYQAPVFWRAQQLQPRWQSRPRFERAALNECATRMLFTALLLRRKYLLFT